MLDFDKNLQFIYKMNFLIKYITLIWTCWNQLWLYTAKTYIFTRW